MKNHKHTWEVDYAECPRCGLGQYEYCECGETKWAKDEMDKVVKDAIPVETKVAMLLHRMADYLHPDKIRRDELEVLHMQIHDILERNK